MPRYIDAEKLCKSLRDMAFYQNPYKQSTILGVVSSIENFPTADVVPRERFDRVFGNLKAVLEERSEDKAEVAREIFEEIEREFCGAYWYKGYTIERHIAELKKKYTEAEPPKGD